MVYRELLSQASHNVYYVKLLQDFGGRLFAWLRALFVGSRKSGKEEKQLLPLALA